MRNRSVMRARRVSLRQGWLVFLAYLALTVLLFCQNRHWAGSSFTVPDNVTVDDVIRGQLNEVPGPLRLQPPSCHPHHDVVFLHCPHCSPSSLDVVFCRHAYLHNLSVVLLDWNQTHSHWSLLSMDQSHRLPSQSFSNNSGTRLVNQNAARLTMIRHPLDMLVSVFCHLGMPISGRINVYTIQTFLKHIRYYSILCKSRLLVGKVPCLFHIHNLLSQSIGMALDVLQNRTRPQNSVKDYIQKLDSEFLLVMLREYLDESLVLLKRVMCWDFKDILYLDMGDESVESAMLGTLTSDDHRLHRKWNMADYLLYEHFNATFWRKVAAHGQGFKEDLLFFRYLRRKVVWFCRDVTPYGEAYLQLPETKVGPAFWVSSRDCQLMNVHLQDMLKDSL